MNLRKTPPLHLAIHSTNKESVKNLLDEGADVNSFDKKNRTPLLIALSQRDKNIVKLLLDYGADVNMKHEELGSPLLLAVDWGDEEVVKYLLGKKACVNARLENNKTALGNAVVKGNLIIIRLLLEHGADINARGSNLTPRELAYWMGNSEVIEAFEIRKAKVDMTNFFDAPLRRVVISQNLFVVKFMLDQGANANAKDEFGDSMLHMAAANSTKDIVKALLDKGADINAEGDYRQTPLFIAATRGNTEIVRLLLDQGADANIRNIYGLTPLHQAAVFGDEEMIEVLLDNQADVNAEDNYHQTPLHAVAQSMDLSNCRLLLERGADVNVIDREGMIPLLVAVRACRQNIVKCLLDNGSDVNITRDQWAIRLSDNIEGYEEMCRPMYEDLRLHMIRLKVAGIHVSDKRLLLRRGRTMSLLSQKSAFGPHDNGFKSNQYESECKDELKKMKSKISGTNVSPYHILTTKNPGYVSNKRLAKVLKSFSHNKFPIYGSLIESKFNSDTTRFSLFEPCKRSLGIIIKRVGGMTLPREVLERIISELSNRDLRNLASFVGFRQKMPVESRQKMPIGSRQRMPDRFAVEVDIVSLISSAICRELSRSMFRTDS